MIDSRRKSHLRGIEVQIYSYEFIPGWMWRGVGWAVRIMGFRDIASVLHKFQPDGESHLALNMVDPTVSVCGNVYFD